MTIGPAHKGYLQLKSTALLGKILVLSAVPARRRAMIYANEALPRPGGAEQNVIERLAAVGRRFSSGVAPVRVLQARPHAIRA